MIHFLFFSSFFFMHDFITFFLGMSNCAKLNCGKVTLPNLNFCEEHLFYKLCTYGEFCQEAATYGSKFCEAHNQDFVTKFESNRQKKCIHENCSLIAVESSAFCHVHKLKYYESNAQKKSHEEEFRLLAESNYLSGDTKQPKIYDSSNPIFHFEIKQEFGGNYFKQNHFAQNDVDDDMKIAMLLSLGVPQESLKEYLPQNNNTKTAQNTPYFPMQNSSSLTASSFSSFASSSFSSSSTSFASAATLVPKKFKIQNNVYERSFIPLSKQDVNRPLFLLKLCMDQLNKNDMDIELSARKLEWNEDYHCPVLTSTTNTYNGTIKIEDETLSFGSEMTTLFSPIGLLNWDLKVCGYACDNHLTKRYFIVVLRN